MTSESKIIAVELLILSLTERDDEQLKHPGLIPYDQLPEEEKQYDRQTTKETLKVVLRSGYKIEKISK